MWLGLAIALALLGALPAAAGAATINVTTTTDELNTGAGCSLREAVHAANNNTTVSGCVGDTAGADTIVLQGGLAYDITLAFSIEDGNVWSDLDITGPTTITTSGSGLATIDGNNDDPQISDRDRVLQVLSTAGQVTLRNLHIRNGWAQAPGSPGGGGILADAPLTVVDSEVSGNRVQVNDAATQGGGIYVRGPLGSLTMTGSTVANNVAQVAGTTAGQTIGGGISVYNAALFVTITNSTVSGNSSLGVNTLGPGLVGGAFLGDGTASTPGATTLTNVTVTQNNASLGGAVTGGLQVGGGTMSGTVVAGNTSDNDPQDCFGFPDASGGANLIGRGEAPWCQLAGAGDLVGSDAAPVLANLGTLVANGGLTRTHLPNAGSPAINRGGSCPATDQRGLFRYIAAPCDSGSVEVGATATPPPTPSTGPTGQRAAALKKCKKIKKKKKRKKCKRKASRLPV
jgi:CSLREA domain-containing protein